MQSFSPFALEIRPACGRALFRRPHDLAGTLNGRPRGASKPSRGLGCGSWSRSTFFRSSGKLGVRNPSFPRPKCRSVTKNRHDDSLDSLNDALQLSLSAKAISKRTMNSALTIGGLSQLFLYFFGEKSDWDWFYTFGCIFSTSAP